MNPLFEALSLFHRKRFEQCRQICSIQLRQNPLDQVTVVHRRFLIISLNDVK